MSTYSMADIASLLGTDNTSIVKNSTSRKSNTELEMTDFLNLMIVQLQNQTIDDTMDTSEMMNQMLQMQMITAMTNMTETNLMSYAASLVGQDVTIGVVSGNTLEEREVRVTGTGTYNGQQVIFGTDARGNTEMYQLNQIMAIGHLPDIEQEDEAVDDVKGSETVDQTQGTDNNTEENKTSGTTGTEETGESSGSTEGSDYTGDQGAPTD